MTDEGSRRAWPPSRRAADILLREVDFPDFVEGLISGTFHAIVDATIEQMETCGELLAAVAKTVDPFLERRATSDAHDHLACRFGDVVAPAVGRRSREARVKLREGVDGGKASRRIKASLPIGGDAVPLLDERTLELDVVPTAQLAPDGAGGGRLTDSQEWSGSPFRRNTACHQLLRTRATYGQRPTCPERQGDLCEPDLGVSCSEI